MNWEESAADIGIKLIEASPVIACSILFCIFFCVIIFLFNRYYNKIIDEYRKETLDVLKSGYADIAEKNNKHLEIIEKSYSDLQKSYNELLSSSSKKEDGNGKRK